MTWYEVIITRGEPSEAEIITGMGYLLQAISFLRDAAKTGRLEGVTDVNLFDQLQVPGDLLVDLLEYLEQPHDWVESDRVYPVYLSEV